MSKYTTGELARLCGITVRTVQYYDTRNILMPSELSEGGRRLYSEEDLKKLKIICFLRELDLPINTIAQLFAEAHPENVIDLLLEQHAAELQDEIRSRQSKLEKVMELQQERVLLEHFSVESIGDIAYRMEHKKKLKTVHRNMLLCLIPLEVAEIGTFVLGMLEGIWWPFLLALAAVIAGSCWSMNHYHKNVSYICPQCHTVFKPRMRELWSFAHTPAARKLTCSSCSHTGMCVETYDDSKPTFH